MRNWWIVVGVMVATAVAPACDTGADRGGEVVVFAAASLTEAFEEIAESFEAANPGVSVTLAFGGSSTLATQILEGAPADVVAVADEPTMETMVDAGAIMGRAEVFATNRLVLAVPAGNPGRVEGLADLADADLLVGLCASQVPCGAAALRVLEDAGVTPSVDTNEPSVRALLAKIMSGELDAGLVYATDVAAAGASVDTVGIPDRPDAVNRYPIAVVGSTLDPTIATRFVDFVLSPDAGAIFVSHGFGVP